MFVKIYSSFSSFVSPSIFSNQSPLLVKQARHVVRVDTWLCERRASPLTFNNGQAFSYWAALSLSFRLISILYVNEHNIIAWGPQVSFFLFTRGPQAITLNINIKIHLINVTREKYVKDSQFGGMIVDRLSWSPPNNPDRVAMKEEFLCFSESSTNTFYYALT